MELEAEAFLARMQDLKLPDGRDRLVRHGHGPERMIQTGIGPVAVSRVKIRDRGAASDDDRVRFSSSILPKWARRTRSLDALLPILYLRGVSTGDFQEALAALLGRDAPNLSPSVIGTAAKSGGTIYLERSCSTAGAGRLEARRPSWSKPKIMPRLRAEECGRDSKLRALPYSPPARCGTALRLA